MAADFPKACASEPCPNAMVEIAERRVVLKASISVADGGWHRVTCRRAAGKLEIIIDGTKRGSATMPAVELNNTAPVTIGAKWVNTSNNDQFQGTIDDVLVTVL